MANTSYYYDNVKGRNVSQSKRQLTEEESRIYKYLINQPAEIRAVTTKLVETAESSAERNATLPREAVEGISNKISHDLIDIVNIKKNLPELETIRDILVSSILSPQDMINENLTFTLDGEFPHKLGTDLLAIIETHFTDHYCLQDKLYTMLTNALFDRGSHILAILPESSIDDILHQNSVTSLESVREKISDTIDKDGKFIGRGIFGRGLKEQAGVDEGKLNQHIALEHFFKDNYRRDMKATNHEIIPGLLSVVDNLDILKSTRLMRKLSDLQIQSQFQTYSAESVMWVDGKSQEEEKVLPVEKLYRDVRPKGTYDGVTIVNDRDGSSRKSIGHPLVLDLPHESVIPVFTPGNPEDHIGYIVLLDESGNPVTYTDEMDRLEQINQFASAVSTQASTDGGSLGGHYGVVTQTLSELNSLAGQGECKWGKMTAKQMTAFYASLIERDLIARLNDGVYGKNVSIPRPLEIYQIMLARALSGSKTQLVYIPESLLEYIAFYYNGLGIGQSLISKSKTTAAHRIAMNYANTRALIRNAVGTKVLNIELDEDDLDHEEIVAKIVNRTMEANSFARLFSSFDPRNIESSMSMFGYEVNVTGGEAVDKTNVNMEYRSGDVPLIDTDYMDQMKNDYISGFIPPTLLDSARDTEFAVEFITKNALFAKRNIIIARTFNRMLTSFVGKYTLHDGELIQELSDAIRESYSELSEDVLEECKAEKSTIPAIKAFLNDLSVSIPLPDSNSNELSNQAMKTYEERVESALNFYIDQDWLDMVFEDLDEERKGEAIKAFRERMKSFFMVQWMDKNSFFPEFNDLIRLNDDEMGDNNLLDRIFSQQAESADIFGDIAKRIRDAYTPPEGEGEGSGDDFSSDDDSSASGSGEDFDLGGDDTSTDDEDDPFATDNDDEPSDDEDKDTEEDTEKTDEDNSEDTSGDEASDDTTSDDTGTDDLGLGDLPKI